jgi:hypothetical protein
VREREPVGGPGGGVRADIVRNRLLGQPRFGLGRLGEHMPRERQRVRRRLVPGEEQRDRVIAHLRRGHRAVLVLGPEQAREHILAPRALGAAAIDEAADGGIEDRGRPLKASIRRQWQPLGDGQQG